MSVIVSDDYTTVLYRHPDTGLVHLSAQNEAKGTQSYVELSESDTRMLIDALKDLLPEEPTP